MSHCWNLQWILDAYKNRDWGEVLELHKLSKSPHLLWPTPEEDDLCFVKGELESLGAVGGILSVGSGSCLLEWLINEATGVAVTCLEIDRVYWSLGHRPAFISHTFPGDGATENALGNEEGAILFCYFNDMTAFLGYAERFKGKAIVIIGPDKPGKYSMPSPFDENIPENWRLYSQKEIGETRDFIAVYCRKNNGEDRED